jgi:RNA polymerase sigma-70 factor (ECF subfamily)
LSPEPPADHARIERLLRDFGALVRNLVQRHCPPHAGVEADDVEQEVRIRLWRALTRDRFEAAHASYIQKVVVSAVVDALRRARVRAMEPLPDEASGVQATALHDPGIGPERRAGALERAALLGRCLATLPERRRAAVELHLQGFTHGEIAGLVGISDEAVRKLVSRGLDELKVLLYEQGMDQADE